ncbi:acyl carrier protein [Ureibacillus sp. GCM10028918]|uniref:acyl carrier protein n=1 Tax=Ureibacillus sp. GCM10028918 TaxID=3273429 RepID=UPI00361A5A34
MTFNKFCETMFSLLEREAVKVSETTSLRDDLDVDSLQMVNLTSSLADHYQTPFNLFIVNAGKLETVGGLYEIVNEGASR